MIFLSFIKMHARKAPIPAETKATPPTAMFQLSSLLKDTEIKRLSIFLFSYSYIYFIIHLFIVSSINSFIYLLVHLFICSYIYFTVECFYTYVYISLYNL